MSLPDSKGIWSGQGQRRVEMNKEKGVHIDCITEDGKLDRCP